MALASGKPLILLNVQDGSRCFKPETASCCGCSSCEWQNSFENLCVGEQLRRIESILYSNFSIPQKFCSPSPGSTPGDLPENQVKINYVEIAGVWNLTDQQVTNNSVIMEVSLIASFNPKYKYLRIRSMGAGFNPANGAAMQYDSKYDRGYFQSHVNIHLQPNTDKLRTLSTDSNRNCMVCR